MTHKAVGASHKTSGASKDSRPSKMVDPAYLSALEALVDTLRVAFRPSCRRSVAQAFTLLKMLEALEVRQNYFRTDSEISQRFRASTKHIGTKASDRASSIDRAATKRVGVKASDRASPIAATRAAQSKTKKKRKLST